MILLHISYFTVSDSGFLAFMLVLPHARFLDLRGRIMMRILAMGKMEEKEQLRQTVLLSCLPDVI